MSKKILVIDDNEDILEIITLSLQHEGFEVVSSDDPDILSEIDSIVPDVILLDNWLSGQKGSELCKELKANPAHAHIPVILVSAVHNLEVIASECYADAFLLKPFDLAQLEDIVNRFV